MLARTLWLAVLLAFATGFAPPVTANLTFDTVFGKEPPWGRMPAHVLWSPDGERFTYVLPSQDPDEVLPVRLYEAATGASRVVLDPARWGARAQTPQVAAWSPDGSRLAILEAGVLYVLDPRSSDLRRIAADAADPQWSPDGRAIAYGHQGDLYLARADARGAVRRLTGGGGADAVLNGTLDWVYPEELGIAHGFRWSPDGGRIAYLRLDERPVTRFPIVDFLERDNRVAYQRYPLAGESNPLASLHVIDLRRGSDRLAYDGGARDEYVAAFGFDRGNRLDAEILDRHQQHLRVLTFDGHVASDLYRQDSVSWVDVEPLPQALRDGHSLWLLDRDRTTNLYLRSADGSLRRLGDGATRVFSIAAVSQDERTAYVVAAYPTRRDRALLAVPLDGSALRNLTADAGTHLVTVSPHGERFVDIASSLNQPYEAVLETSADLGRRVIVARDEQFARELLPISTFSVPSRFGPLDGTMLLPPNFDPAKRYPVVVYVYGGPDAPVTADSFGDQRGLYHQLLARAGFIVASIDGPASQIDDSAHVRLLLHDFGPASLNGQEIAAAYLRSLPYVDASRIGIWGWSFGGYETCYAMTHSTSFKAGAAVAPVTDWHLYDSIYTERYMGLPQQQSGAYDTSSVLDALGSLHGPLLVQHGTGDDNVHTANTISLLQAAILAHKTNVQTMLYPRKTRSIAGLAQRRSLYQRMLEFWKTNL